MLAVTSVIVENPNFAETGVTTRPLLSFSTGLGALITH